MITLADEFSSKHAPRTTFVTKKYITFEIHCKMYTSVISAFEEHLRSISSDKETRELIGESREQFSTRR